MGLMDMVYGVMGTGLLAIAAINGLLMLETIGRKPTRGGFRRAHKWLGRLYVVVFAFLFMAMFPRIAYLEGMPPTTLCHLISGLSLLPFVVAKVLAGMRYKQLHASLPTLGFMVIYFTYMTILTSGFYVVFFKPMS